MKKLSLYTILLLANSCSSLSNNDAASTKTALVTTPTTDNVRTRNRVLSFGFVNIPRGTIYSKVKSYHDENVLQYVGEKCKLESPEIQSPKIMPDTIQNFEVTYTLNVVCPNFNDSIIATCVLNEGTTGEITAEKDEYCNGESNQYSFKDPIANLRKNKVGINAIMNNAPFIGMDEKFLAPMFPDVTVHESIYASGVHRQYVISNSIYIYTINGKVTGIQH